MPAVTKISDKGNQHDGYHEAAIIAGLLTVFIDGLPTAKTDKTVGYGN